LIIICYSTVTEQLIEREYKESSKEDLVVGRDQVKQKKSPLRIKQLLETGVVLRRRMITIEKQKKERPLKDFAGCFRIFKGMI